MTETTTLEALWWAVIVSGFYHGANPGMGWPLAVSAALMERKLKALPIALAMLALGHFLSMLAVLLPFSMMSALVDWQDEIRICAGMIVIGFGVYLVINRRHPRFLARIPPTRLALWSFLAAIAHGAGLMLVPIYLGICTSVETDAGHWAASRLMSQNIIAAISVAAAHTAAMVVAGGLFATVIYFWLGLKFLSKSWFNLDLLWAFSLILVGIFSIWTAIG